jgi:hypothetical protein
MVFTINRYMSRRTENVAGCPPYQGMNFQIAALTNLPAPGAGSSASCGPCGSFARTPNFRSRSSGLQALRQPFDGVGDRGAKSLGNRLQVVVAEIEKGFAAKFVACSIRSLQQSL